jgi:hypothetical protein
MIEKPSPKPDTEGRDLFEKAVDKALHTPPTHKPKDDKKRPKL